MNTSNHTIIPLLAGLLLFITGCASVISKDVLKQAELHVTVPMVQTDPKAYTGRKVVWGGLIVSTENLENKTLIEVFQTRLDFTQSPTREPLANGGRFIVAIEGYADPLIYREKKGITAAGVITGIETKKIGKMDYAYPVVTPVELHLFDMSEETAYPPPPYYYQHPMYQPYYWPYYPWWYRPYPY